MHSAGAAGIDDLLCEADGRMYAAKRSRGRLVKLGTDRHSALIYPYAAAHVIGRAVLRDARWSIQKRSGGAYHSVGWVPSRCPVTFAAAAGRILLW